MGYRVVKDLRSEVKIAGSLYLKDFFLLIIVPTAAWLLVGTIVTEKLKLAFVAYNALVTLILLQRPRTNPHKQVWQVLLMMLTDNERIYHAEQMPTGKEEISEDAIV